MLFTPAYSGNKPISDNALCLMFEKGGLWCSTTSEDNGAATLPHYADLPDVLQIPSSYHYLGQYDSQPCYVALLDIDEQRPDAFETEALRGLLTKTDGATAALVNLGYHIYCWDKHSGFCSRCGSNTIFMENERGKVCEQCDFRIYPRVSPCIIVAIVKNDSELLLAEIKRENIHFHSVLAGFVEAGETLEAGVAREVQEEVGLKIKNIRYFGSQSWAFSQSLMIGFTAEYESGEIECDGVEVHVADWYKAEDLPALPPKYSIARQLIEWFRES